jgi:tetratricopeptide (TPR) repeat protein
MDTQFPIVYIAALLILLVTAGVFVLQQVLKTRKIEGALSKLQGKLSKEKGTALEYYELGSIYLDKKLFTQAVAQLQKAIKLDELEGEAQAAVYNALGFAYFAQDQYDLAMKNYKEALKAFPEYVTALNNLGHAYERKQQAQKALEMYAQALSYEPENATAKRRSAALQKRFVTPAA